MPGGVHPLIVVPGARKITLISFTLQLANTGLTQHHQHLIMAKRIFIDMDGVIYSGDDLIPGAINLLGAHQTRSTFPVFDE